jgi:hypothetical protein
MKYIKPAAWISLIVIVGFSKTSPSETPSAQQQLGIEKPILPCKFNCSK